MIGPTYDIGDLDVQRNTIHVNSAKLIISIYRDLEYHQSIQRQETVFEMLPDIILHPFLS